MTLAKRLYQKICSVKSFFCVCTVSLSLASHFVESFVLEYLKRMQLLGEDKSLENMSLLLAELFNFKVSGCYLSYHSLPPGSLTTIILLRYF